MWPRRGHRPRSRGYTLIEVLVVLTIIGILVALLLPAVQGSREAARRAGCSNNLRQIGLALMQYHDAQGRFPPAYLMSRSGQPLLSWRVAVLPHLEQQNLYDRFRLDEPWDGPSNDSLRAAMPAVWSCPSGDSRVPHATYYQGFVGGNAAFHPSKGRALQTFLDGPSQTLLVVEAGDGVPWTRPADLEVTDHAASLLERLKDKRHPGGFHGLFGDGSVQFLSDSIAPGEFRHLITRMGSDAGP